MVGVGDVRGGGVSLPHIHTPDQIVVNRDTHGSTGHTAQGTGKQKSIINYIIELRTKNIRAKKCHLETDQRYRYKQSCANLSLLLGK